MSTDRLVVLATHPVQYHAPVHRTVQALGLPVTVIYGSDMGVAGYTDREFGVSLKWDTDLTSGYTPRFLRGVAEAGTNPAGRAEIRAAIDEAQGTALLLTGYTGHFHRNAVLASLGVAGPRLFRAETTDHALRRGPAKRLLRDLVLRGFYAGCDRLLYIGARSSDHYRRLAVAEEKLVFSPYCVSLEPFEPGEEARTKLRAYVRAELGLASDRRVLMFSGKLSERKGPRLLIDALARLPQAERARWTILFVGDGELRPALEQHGTDVDTRFVGFQPQRNLSRFFHAADVFALPSLTSETWGLVVNEALHHGVPTLASDAVGCTPDLVRSGVSGEVFATGSVDALGQAFDRLMAWHGMDAATRDRCRATVAEYTVERAARGVLEAYEGARRAGGRRAA